MQYKETNLNNYIKVKLTEKGKEIYRNRFDEDDIKELGIEYCEPKINKDGYTEFLIWDFMRIFGKHFHILGDNPCETKCMVQVKNDENKTKEEQLENKAEELARESVDYELEYANTIKEPFTKKMFLDWIKLHIHNTAKNGFINGYEYAKKHMEKK